MNFFKKIEKSSNIRIQFIKYSLIGIVSLLIDFGIYIFAQSIISLSPSNAKIVSFITASINSFIMNKRITFNSKGLSFTQPIRFAILYIISLFFNSVTHDFVLKYSTDYLPFISATVISVLINFTGQKYWVFRKKNDVN
tara:strand:+ start:61 stop:477 length:417 start_codon:yes stop_codon:yes gene_type:complete